MIFVKKCDEGRWIFLEWMSHCVNKSILGTLGLKIASISLAYSRFASTSIKIIWQSYFGAILAIFTFPISPFPIKNT